MHDGSLLEFHAKGPAVFWRNALPLLENASQSTNCFQISALGPRALVISADQGFSVLPINAFGVIELFLRSKQRQFAAEMMLLSEGEDFYSDGKIPCSDAVGFEERDL